MGETMFRALSDAGINIQLINTSEIRMSAGGHGQAALDHLLDAFGLQQSSVKGN